MTRLARTFGLTWLFHLKGLTTSSFFVLISVLQSARARATLALT